MVEFMIYRRSNCYQWSADEGYGDLLPFLKPAVFTGHGCSTGRELYYKCKKSDFAKIKRGGLAKLLKEDKAEIIS